MKIKDYKCKCGNDDFFFDNKRVHIGIYCSRCGKWLKWADSDERNLRMKQQVDVLDKIRAEIDEARFIDKDTRICKNALASGLELAMEIIDKYKTESEGEEE